MLIDSNSLVWLAQGRMGAVTPLHALNPCRISAVTYKQLAQLNKGLAARHTD